MQRYRLRSTFGTGLICVVLCLGAAVGGCVTSECSRYERKLDSTVAADTAAAPAVAIAFSLDEHGQPTVMAVVRDDE